MIKKPPTIIDGIACYAPELAYSNRCFPAESFSRLFVLEENNFWFRSRSRLIEFFVSRFISENSTDFLEVGCGTGFVLKGLSKHKHLNLVGAEIHIEGLRWACQRLPSIEFIQLDATHIPFSNQFDAIGVFDVIEHIDEDEKVLSGIYDALREKGILFVTVPQHKALWSQSDDLGGHKRRYTRHEMLDKLNSAGFVVQKTTSFVFLLLPLMYISRLISRRKRYTKVCDACELDLPRWLNRCFAIFMRIEELLIYAGCSLPIGGSLLVVAQKKD